MAGESTKLHARRHNFGLPAGTWEKFSGKKTNLLTTVEKRHTPFSGNSIVKDIFCEKFSHKMLLFRKLFVIFYIGETKCY
jgi:hypothetical protein